MKMQVDLLFLSACTNFVIVTYAIKREQCIKAKHRHVGTVLLTLSSFALAWDKGLV